MCAAGRAFRVCRDRVFETAGDSQDEEGEALVDAEIELEHNVIILYQYEVADELIEAYRNSVLREPDSRSNEELHEETSDIFND